MLVFCVWFEFDSNIDTHSRNALLDQWIKEAIECNGLQFGGGGLSNTWEGVVELARQGDLKEEQRKIVEKWLQNNDKISRFRVGPIVENTKLWELNKLILE